MGAYDRVYPGDPSLRTPKEHILKGFRTFKARLFLKDVNPTNDRSNLGLTNLINKVDKGTHDPYVCLLTFKCLILIDSISFP